MEFVLNEESLNGQFDSVSDFLKSLQDNKKCFKLIHANEGNQIYKIRNLYDSYITDTDRIRDLKNYGCSDDLLDLQLVLDREIYDDPYWDDEILHNMEKTYIYDGRDVTATSIAEAVERERKLLSFKHEDFIDMVINVSVDERTAEVYSIYTPKYLVQICGKNLRLSGNDILKIEYEDTRIDCSKIFEKYGADYLEREELKQVKSTFDKFIRHESWESIDLDDGLEYKKYKPSQKSKNIFNGTLYKNKDIMKFRASDILRVFGYRKGDKFIVLRFERDHKISDNG